MDAFHRRLLDRLTYRSRSRLMLYITRALSRVTAVTAYSPAGGCRCFITFSAASYSFWDLVHLSGAVPERGLLRLRLLVVGADSATGRDAVRARV